MMEQGLKRIGLELQRFYQSAVRSRLDWKMIDAVERLQEREDALLKQRCDPTAGDPSTHPDSKQ